jgi:S1-C subfamily serine protease
MLAMAGPVSTVTCAARAGLLALTALLAMPGSVAAPAAPAAAAPATGLPADAVLPEPAAPEAGTAPIAGDPDAPPSPLDADAAADLDWDQGPVSAAARRMLDRVQGAVVRVRGFYGGNRAEAFHGTAFAVAPGGLLLTNYHVIARAALAPQSYRLEYATNDGGGGALTILAVDVVHDLAIVRAADFAPQPIPLRTVIPDRGDRVYTVGYPLNLGLVITEGIGNGLLDKPFSPRLNYAGPMNPGMSGGPALDSRGRVIGVNVAFSTRGQLVSFLVPAEFVAPLVGRAVSPLLPHGTRAEVARQLEAHQARVLKALPARFPTQVAAGYALPAELAPFVDCTAIPGTPAVSSLLLQQVACRATVGLSVEPGLQTGDFEFSHSVLVADGLHPLQFAEQLRDASAAAPGRRGSAEHVLGWSCRQSLVNLTRLQAAVVLCARRYRRYDGLYDLTLVVTSRNQPLRGFVSTATLRGVDFAAGLDFTRRYLEAMRWTR